MLANVREGTPATKRWHISSVVLSRKRDGDSGPRLVGLVGDSGVGKTTVASDVVRSTWVLEAIPDGVVWPAVNEGAKEGLPEC